MVGCFLTVIINQKIEKQMQRPPKPIIKSTKIFAHNNFRKILTPDCFLQQLQSCLAEQPIKSLRDVLITTSTGLHSSLNQVQNMQYLQISKNNQTASIGGITTNTGHVNVQCSFGLGFGHSANVVSGRSFKIRNFGNSTTKIKGIKENSIPIKLNGTRPDLCLVHSQPMKADQGGIEFIKLHSYPKQFQFQEMGSKLYYQKLAPKIEHSTSVTQRQYSKWAIILSQSLFYGSLLSQTNLLKLKYLTQNLQKHHKNLPIILRLHSQRDLPTILSTLSQKQLPLCCVVWGKHRYFETINFYDMTEISGIFGFDRFVVVEDSYQVIRSVYYQGLGRKGQGQGDKDKDKDDVDYGCKYLYLRFQGLAKFVRFSQRFKIYKEDDQICAEKCGYTDDTQALLKLDELNQKIRISANKKLLKLQKPRKSSQPMPQTRPQSQKQTPSDKTQQLRQKVLQLTKTLQQHKRRQSVECTRNRTSNKSLKSNPNANQPNPTNKRAETPSHNTSVNMSGSGKNYQQIVAELVKNNVGINKQICKFRDKLENGIVVRELR